MIETLEDLFNKDAIRHMRFFILLCFEPYLFASLAYPVFMLLKSDVEIYKILIQRHKYLD